ncbi:hypothetical protein AB0C96_41410 [Streptomyces sp. NPDC048506]
MSHRTGLAPLAARERFPAQLPYALCLYAPTPLRPYARANVQLTA